MTPVKTGTLSTTDEAFWTLKKPSPLIAMLVATEDVETVPWVVMVALAKAVTPPAFCRVGLVALGIRSSKLVPMPL